ncbi:MAG: 2-dehydropantoate 2-reductase N-terminal domain-containing protein [Acidimicrobiales bacterium]|jgi:2-dehydropantoate 2-reductase
MRTLVVGAGVIGSVYAAKLLEAGHEVVLLARGRRLSDLQARGLVLEDAGSGRRTEVAVPSLNELVAGDRYDLVVVPVRSEQLASTIPVLLAMSDDSDVLFFGNTVGRQAELVAAIGGRAMFGFPAVGGVRDGPVVRYVMIRQQKTMLGEATRMTTPRVRQLQKVLVAAGFPTRTSANIDGWMLGHAAFVVPIGFALYRVGTDPAKLAADRDIVALMVRATREAFRVLVASGIAEIPANLRMLYLHMPTAFIVRYWQRVFAGPRGELWFAAHSRAAPDEMHALADELQAALGRVGQPTPDLDNLLSPLAP